MSLLLFDTTVSIDAERNRIDLDATIADDDDVAIAAITVAELLIGVKLASGKRRSIHGAYVERVISAIPIIAYDLSIAVEHADLTAQVREDGRPRGAHDLLIAATARASGRTIVSADRRGFDGLAGVAAVGYS